MDVEKEIVPEVKPAPAEKPVETAREYKDPEAAKSEFLSILNDIRSGQQ